MDAGSRTVTFRAQREAPPLTLVGVRKPRVLVSESTVALLSPEELQIALKHEIAHMQSCDNLKKLIFRFLPLSRYGHPRNRVGTGRRTRSG